MRPRLFHRSAVVDRVNIKSIPLHGLCRLICTKRHCARRLMLCPESKEVRTPIEGLWSPDASFFWRPLFLDMLGGPFTQSSANSPVSRPSPFPRLGSGSRALTQLGIGFEPRRFAHPRRRDRNRGGNPPSAQG